MRRFRLVVLGLIAVMLAAAVALEVAGDRPSFGAFRPPLRAETVPEPMMGADGRLDDGLLSTILARPLFDATRRLASRGNAPALNRAAPALPRLAGIVVDGERRSAIFTLPSDGRVVTAGLGGQVDGYSVEMIMARQVTLSAQGSRYVLRLSFDPSPAAVVRNNPVATLAPPLQGGSLPAFNGPPGLANMPALVRLPEPTDTPSILGGIPGLTPLAPSQAGPTRP